MKHLTQWAETASFAGNRCRLRSCTPPLIGLNANLPNLDQPLGSARREFAEVVPADDTSFSSPGTDATGDATSAC